MPLCDVCQKIDIRSMVAVAEKLEAIPDCDPQNYASKLFVRTIPLPVKFYPHHLDTWYNSPHRKMYHGLSVVSLVWKVCVYCAGPRDHPNTWELEMASKFCEFCAPISHQLKWSDNYHGWSEKGKVSISIFMLKTARFTAAPIPKARLYTRIGEEKNLRNCEMFDIFASLEGSGEENDSAQNHV
ncbi:hypothetical protein BDZ45DRAFT_741899 [Acephala macrosclerotiorum]|nr:hypothetical protein BDZ45DRAFT_741899 [Acephala macrosclerotiorum]